MDDTEAVRDRVVKVLEKIAFDEGMNYGQIAARIGADVSRISEWRKGRGNPTTLNLVLIAREFYISPAYLLLGEESEGISNASRVLADLVKRVEKLESKEAKKV